LHDRLVKDVRITVPAAHRTTVKVEGVSAASHLREETRARLIAFMEDVEELKLRFEGLYLEERRGLGVVQQLKSFLRDWTFGLRCGENSR
jgi:hypothetical protein